MPRKLIRREIRIRKRLQSVGKVAITFHGINLGRDKGTGLPDECFSQLLRDNNSARPGRRRHVVIIKREEKAEADYLYRPSSGEVAILKFNVPEFKWPVHLAAAGLRSRAPDIYHPSFSLSSAEITARDASWVSARGEISNWANRARDLRDLRGERGVAKRARSVLVDVQAARDRQGSFYMHATGIIVRVEVSLRSRRLLLGAGRSPCRKKLRPSISGPDSALTNSRDVRAV